MKENRNTCFDFLKGLACIGVVLIHVPFPSVAGEIVSKIAQFAVPLFFMIAGYYAYGKNETIIKRRGKKIFMIFISSYGLYLVCHVTEHIAQGDLMFWLGQHVFSIKSILKMVVFCTVDFVIPLWYLIAMAEMYLLWVFVVRYGCEEQIRKLIPFALLLYIGITVFCETMEYAWFWKINFISRALPWFLIGNAFANKSSGGTGGGTRLDFATFDNTYYSRLPDYFGTCFV